MSGAESMESKSSVSDNSSSVGKWPTVLVFEELHTLIGSVKEIGPVATMDEVLEGMKRYILNKRLFDPSNPFRVCCKDDKLGSVLGVEEFTIAQVKTLLTKVVTPVQNSKNDSSGASTCLQSDSLSKRKLEESAESEQRKVFLADVSSTSSPMKLYIPPTPEYCCESDTNDSVQGYETALVRDTSDTSGDSIYQVEDIYDIEYEVESVVSDLEFSDSSCSASDINSDSEVVLNAAILTFLCKTDSDIEFFADDSSDDQDEEISEFDHWECNRCRSLNRPPMRYCARCWEERREWLPDSRPTPPRRRKSKNKFLCKEASQFLEDSTDSTALVKCDPDTTSVVSSPSEDASSANSKLCIICCNKAANASIIHAKYAHQVTCYRCARRLQKRGKRCPICRRSIDRVVHQIAS